ncbi:hypothetical protein A8M77_31145 [Variovorax sp. JS1663]|nr:hypothetical protein A8M77_31145 [Variovorax sp. JS1663]
MAAELDSWQARNNNYLGAALASLRERLDAAAQAPRAVLVPSQAAPEPAPAATLPAAAPAESRQPKGSGRSPMGFFRRPPLQQPGGAVPLLASAPIANRIEMPPDDAARRLAAAAEGDPPPALMILARRLGLSDFERDILLLCVALELDTGTAARCAAAQGRADRDHPSFGLAMTLFDDPAWEALSPERPLRYWRLVEINQPGARALTSSALRADERIVNFVKGLNYLDDRLAPLLLPVNAPPLEKLPPSQRDAVATLTRILVADAPAGQAWHAVASLRGRDRQSKREIAGVAAAMLGMQLHRLPADALPAHPAELETLARLWERESLLLPVALYIDAHDIEKSAGPDSPAHRLGHFVARTGGLLMIDSRDGIELPVEPAVSLDVGKPTTAEQLQAWTDAIGARAPDQPARLSAQFDLNRPDIERIAATTLARSDGMDDAAFGAALWTACREKTRPMLARLAQRLDARASWDQLVLPAQETALLEQIAAQVHARSQVYDTWGFRARMNRGLGVSALFAGDSGTGKTMAAEVLANALQLDLYRIDLSAVVDKYIGETEKNLRKVFDAAECGGAILFFDEADALFGKRSEVKDSHDRYANIEIDYLLQRMEAFSGLAILATNMKSALDTAFIRRLRFVVNFPYPGPAERRRMWERVFPADTPLAPLDYERLGRLDLTGGNIQSIALTAAFMAARAGTKVTTNLLLEAGRMELRKLDRPVNEADFRYVEAAEGSAARETS